MDKLNEDDEDEDDDDNEWHTPYHVMTNDQIQGSFSIPIYTYTIHKLVLVYIFIFKFFLLPVELKGRGNPEKKLVPREHSWVSFNFIIPSSQLSSLEAKAFKTYTQTHEILLILIRNAQ